MTKALIYTRVSSEAQLDGYSLDEQERVCANYCAAHGYEVEWVYRDEARTAKTTNRPEFQRMLDHARTGSISAVVFYHTWRFSRNTQDGALMRKLEAGGTKLVSVSEGIDTTSSSGKLQRNIALTLGEYQLDQLRDATRGGKQARVRAGLSNANRPPWGYRRVFEVINVSTKNIVGHDVLTDDAPIVREMFERYETAQYSPLELAIWLNAQGKRAVTGCPFGKVAVARMLRNGFYAGFVAYLGQSDIESADGSYYRRNSRHLTQWVKGVHEPLISVDLFERCQAVTRARAPQHTAGRLPKRVCIFSKVLYCKHCGGRLRVTNWRDTSTKAYGCTARERGCECGATHRLIRESDVLADLDKIVSVMQIPSDMRANAAALIEGLDTTGETERQSAKLEAELTRLNRMYQAGNVDDGYYDRESARIKSSLVALARDTAPRTVNIQRAMDALDSMAALWAGATEAEKAGIVRGIFEAFKIDLDTRRVYSFTPRKEIAALLKTALHNRSDDEGGQSVA